MQGIETIGMKAIHYNISSGKVDYIYLSIVLRISYLILDKVLLAGDSKHLIYTEQTFKEATLLERIAYMEKTFSNIEDFDPDFISNLKSMKGMINGFKNLKHPNKQIIVAYNKMIHNLEGIYKKHVNWLLNISREFGLMELKGIVDNDTFDFLFLKNDPTLSIIDGDNKMNEVFCINGLKPSKEEEQVIITVGNDFTFPEFMKDSVYYCYNDIEAVNESNTYLHNCLRFPIPTTLKAEELKLVRNYLNPSSILLNKALNDWSNYFNEPLSTENSINFFVNNIIPTLSLVQQSIDSNSILTSLIKSEINTNPYIDVWIGEAPLKTIWEFYLYNKMIDEDEYQQLLAATEINPLLKKRVPIMVITSENKAEIKADDTEDINDIDIMPSRKSILINE